MLLLSLEQPYAYPITVCTDGLGSRRTVFLRLGCAQVDTVGAVTVVLNTRPRSRSSLSREEGGARHTEEEEGWWGVKPVAICHRDW